MAVSNVVDFKSFQARIAGRMDTVNDSLSTIINDCLANLKSLSEQAEKLTDENNALKEKLKRYEPIAEKTEAK